MISDARLFASLVINLLRFAHEWLHTDCVEYGLRTSDLHGLLNWLTPKYGFDWPRS